MMFDLRSDTVTKPDKAMINAMASAEVGDDVFAEDPTVNELQERLADMFSQEAGLFCPSGTMTNQIAINVHTRPGDEVICDRLSHIYNYEGGGIARNSGASVRLVNGDRGRFTVDQIKGEVNPSDSHYARTSLISIEDTCNKGGGAIYDVEEIKKLSTFAKVQGLAFHLDGARVFNALAENNTLVSSYGKHFDSISVCLSKGLGTPGGSVLLGSKSFIQEAHRTRKALGGGMRQVGILAAAGLHALEHHAPLLREDHDKARKTASILEEQSWVKSVMPVHTNIVIFDLIEEGSAEQRCHLLEQKGIRSMPFGPSKIRFVYHRDITPQDMVGIEAALRS
ncbi:MAG: aminotransferase class I/II-fold pyridoxal phosphate-dependent enzyme [Flavobacteriales bacterium]|nr:aminotransferase class I/II-fold pyridoxal phosphate-dependent enzyme [Flavobacteriales bacterium]